MNVLPNITKRLVEEVPNIVYYLQRNVQTPADSESDEANVGGGQHVDVENDKLFDASDSQKEHRHEAVDSLFHAISSKFVDTACHVVRHRSHSAAHILDIGACCECFGFG